MATYLKADSTATLNGVTVNEYLLTKHNPNKISMPTGSMDYDYVTIHNTDWIAVNSATTPSEQYTRATVNGNMKSTRVHYYVDNICAWQNLPLILQGWHAADGSGKGNTKSVAIECIMSSAYNATDQKSEDNAARLCAWLLFNKGFSIDRLRTHTYWLNTKDKKTGTVDYLNVLKHSYKWCPAYILPHWATFKTKVQAYLDDLNGNKTTTSTLPKANETTIFTPYLVKVLSKDGFVNIRKTPNFTDSDIVGKIANGATKYTIVDETVVDGITFGKLKSGIGWVSLKCCLKG